MDDRQDQSAGVYQDPLTGVQSIIDVVYHHGMRVPNQPEIKESSAPTKTMMVRLGVLCDLHRNGEYPPMMKGTGDMVNVRIHHRYRNTTDLCKNSLYGADSNSSERVSTQDSTISHASQVIKEVDTWSSALFDLDRTQGLLSQDTINDLDGLVDLNRFCYFCQQLCEASRAFNTYVFEEDTAMPEPELSDDIISGFPHRTIQEYFEFWPSSAEMLASSRNGCHLCTIICQKIVERIDDPRPRARVVPCSGPVKLIVSWKWSHRRGPNLPACVKRDLSLGWPMSETCHGRGEYFLMPQRSMWLGLQTHAKSEKDQLFSEIQSADYYRHSTKTRSYSPHDQTMRPSPALHDLFPSLGNREDHLLSHYTGSEAVMSLALSWISSCHEKHTCHTSHLRYSKPFLSFRPTRLLDVGSADGIQDPKLDIQEPDSVPVRYLALSHCWGNNANRSYKLTTETEKELLQGVQIQRLSRTFQDAINVCRKLKQRYIWIDSLCIKQDDGNDWAREAAQMHLIYAKSYCTIAAVCARGGEEGFLRSRNPRVNQACKFPTKICLSIAGVWSEHPRLSKRRLEAPLFTRAWTLQERLLSPCMLRFDEDSIAWECQECVLREGQSETSRSSPLPGGGVTRARARNLFTDWNVESGTEPYPGFFGLWRSLISNYTNMALTEPQDRPFAFQGLASHITRISSRNAYRGGGKPVYFFDGLPVPYLLPSLLWRVTSAKAQRRAQSITEDGAKTSIMAECYVNTLSWVSIEGAVGYLQDWPVSVATSPPTTIFAPDFSSGTFTLQKRTQVVELFADPKPCGKAEFDDKVSLIHVHNLLSRVTLEGPTFDFTTPSSFESRTMSPGGCMLHCGPLGTNHGLKNSFTLMNLDLGCLRFSHFGLSMHVICLTVIEWEGYRGILVPQKDMAREEDGSWEPNCAAGIVLIKSKGGEKDVYWNTAEEIYTRIGYWELVKWNPHHPPYGPIRKEAKVRRVTVI